EVLRARRRLVVDRHAEPDAQPGLEIELEAVAGQARGAQPGARARPGDRPADEVGGILRPALRRGPPHRHRPRVVLAREQAGDVRRQVERGRLFVVGAGGIDAHHRATAHVAVLVGVALLGVAAGEAAQPRRVVAAAHLVVAALVVALGAGEAIAL